VYFPPKLKGHLAAKLLIASEKLDSSKNDTFLLYRRDEYMVGFGMRTPLRGLAIWGKEHPLTGIFLDER